jgi:enoyl-CoA hydratase/carnithine racemase
VPLIDGGTVRLPRIIGMGRAMNMILTGLPVGAREPLAMGLANRVVPNGESRPAAESIAREIPAFPQACMRVDRRSAYMQWDVSLADALRQEGRWLPRLSRWKARPAPDTLQMARHVTAVSENAARRPCFFNGW